MLLLAGSVVLGCPGERTEERTQAAASASAPPALVSSAPVPEPPPAAPPRRDTLLLLAGGDVSFGRLAGQMLLKNPQHDFFSTLSGWFASADVRFANLEGPLSDQKGETVSPANNLVFTGPPEGAPALARAGFTIVSTANNHAWDYGKNALFETMEHLRGAGVSYAGTGRDRSEAYRAVIVDRGGFRLALLAVTDIWNQGLLAKHPGAEYVAGADEKQLAEAVRALRADSSIDAIAVSHHGGSEYVDEPLQRTRAILRAAMDAGADVVIGHHPHVIQGVEWRNGRAILYSLGNLLMRMHSDYPATELGFLARITFRRGARPAVEACPYRIFGLVPVPLFDDRHRAAYEGRFFNHLRSISRRTGGTAIGPLGVDGCARLSPEEAAPLPAANHP
jgi:poly-gamma-glutamate synthesis protein (capsule biosynthesis protein)